jgi:hypothetical protein
VGGGVWRRRLASAALTVALLGGPAAFAQTTPPPAALNTAPAPGVVAPAPPGVPAAPSAASAPAIDAPAAAAPPERIGPIPTADEQPAPSDHDAVVGRLGIEARRMDVGPLPLALGPNGCPAATIAAGDECAVTMGVLGARYWKTRNLAWNLGLALAAGGGRDAGQSLDTYVGLGPVVGMSLLLANWRHLSIAASPELAVVWFRPGGDAASTKLVQLRGALEGELHFGFVGVQALSVGILAGLGFQYESVPDTRVWSVGVLGGGSVWGTLTNLYVRYYL